MTSENSVICVACGQSPRVQAQVCGRDGGGARVTEFSYLNEILLLLFSAGNGLFDGFCFPQDSLSFIQFVAALSIRHFLIDSRRQPMGKVRDGARGGVSPRQKQTTVLHPLKKSPLSPACGIRHRRTLFHCKRLIMWGSRSNTTQSQGSCKCQLLQEAFPDYLPGSSRLG